MLQILISDVAWFLTEENFIKVKKYQKSLHPLHTTAAIKVVLRVFVNRVIIIAQYIDFGTFQQFSLNVEKGFKIQATCVIFLSFFLLQFKFYEI